MSIDQLPPSFGHVWPPLGPWPIAYGVTDGVHGLRALRSPPLTTGRPLGVAGRLLLFPPIHAAAYALRWVGLRDRLRCPSCKAIGTWKPHGTFSSRIFHKDRPTRRWMCKWCGLYVGPEGIIRVYPDLDLGCWALPAPWYPDAKHWEAQITPKDAVAKLLSHDDGKPVWPWRG